MGGGARWSSPWKMQEIEATRTVSGYPSILWALRDCSHKNKMRFRLCCGSRQFWTDPNFKIPDPDPAWIWPHIDYFFQNWLLLLEFFFKEWNIVVLHYFNKKKVLSHKILVWFSDHSFCQCFALQGPGSGFFRIRIRVAEKSRMLWIQHRIEIFNI